MGDVTFVYINMMRIFLIEVINLHAINFNLIGEIYALNALIYHFL